MRMRETTDWSRSVHVSRNWLSDSRWSRRKSVPTWRKIDCWHLTSQRWARGVNNKKKEERMATDVQVNLLCDAKRKDWARGADGEGESGGWEEQLADVGNQINNKSSASYKIEWMYRFVSSFTLWLCVQWRPGRFRQFVQEGWEREGKKKNNGHSNEGHYRGKKSPLRL